MHRTNWLIRSGVLLALASPPLLAQDAGGEAASPDASDSAQEEIVVLGSRRTDRSVADSASPVDVIGAEELAKQPAADMLEVLKNVVPSFNVGQNQISDASTFVRAPSMRFNMPTVGSGLRTTKFEIGTEPCEVCTLSSSSVDSRTRSSTR